MPQVDSALGQVLELLGRYSAGQIPPLIDLDQPDKGLIDKNLFEIYQIGFRQRGPIARDALLAQDHLGLPAERWQRAKVVRLNNSEVACSKFCAAIRAKKEGDEACIACERAWAHQAEKEGQTIVYMCVHGLIEYAVPIRVDNITAAVIIAGQFRPKTGAAWNPELIQPQGSFRPLAPEEKGVQAWLESQARIRRTEQSLGFSQGQLLGLLVTAQEQEGTPQDVTAAMQSLNVLRGHLSELATTRLESDRGKLHSWLVSGISYSLGQLNAEPVAGAATGTFRGVANESITAVWTEMGDYLKYIRQYFGFLHLAVLAVDSWNGGGTISLLGHHGHSSTEFPFPRQYDCTKSHTSLKELAAGMKAWREATEVNLERYANLPVIESLLKALRHRHSDTTYGMSVQFVKGISPILVLGGLDRRRRIERLSENELKEFTEIAKEIGLVANAGTLVTKLDEERDLQARFIEDVAHDIRGPIMNINSLAEFLHIDHISIEEKKIKAKQIAAEAKRIYDLGQRVWVLEDIRRGALDPRKRRSVSVFEVVAMCRKSLSAWAARNRVEISIDKEIQNWPTILVNYDLFYHTVLNLMDNGIKYSWPETEIRVGGSANPQEYILTFGNIGIGVPESERDMIFERHYRAKNAQVRIREGTGIGLSIVKAFADHYGSIEIENSPLKGHPNRYLTVFRLRIRRE